MRTVSYNEILQPLAELYGVEYADLDAELGGRFKGFIARRLREAWEDAFWPGLTRVEKRRFAPVYLDSKTYAAGEFVYYPPAKAYFQCLIAGSGNAPTDANGNTDENYWAKAGVSWSGNDWASGTSYVVGEVVYYRPSNQWYQCISATSSADPGTAAGLTNWGLLRPFRKILQSQPTEATVATTAGVYSAPDVVLTLAEGIELAVGDRIAVAGVTPAEYNGEFAVVAPLHSVLVSYEPGDDPGTYSGAGTVRKIYEEPGLVRGVYSKDPEAHSDFVELDFQEVDNGWLVPQAPVEVWLEFRKVAPLLTGSAYSAATTYTAGEQVLFTNGSTKNFYNCKVATAQGESPTTDPMKWELVELPYIFQTFIVYAALSDALKMDGNHAAAGATMKIARESLEEEQVKQWNLQPQRNRVAVAY